MIVNIHAHAYDKSVIELRIRSGYHPVVPAGPPHVFLKDKAAEYYSTQTLERFIVEMDEAGVDKAVILPVDVERTLNFVTSDEYVYENWVTKYPDRLIGFSGVDPIDRAGRLNWKALRSFEKSIKEYGFKGLKLLPTYGHYAPNDRRVYLFYQKALEFDVPVLLHMGATPLPNAPIRYSRPELLEDVAMDFPDLPLIMAHLAKPWTEELYTLMIKYGNIYTDISALCKLGLRMLTWYLVMAKEYGVLNRVMWGTDKTCMPHKYYVDWCKTGLNQTAEKHGWPTFTKQEIDNLMGETAAKLLKL